MDIVSIDCIFSFDIVPVILNGVTLDSYGTGVQKYQVKIVLAYAMFFYGSYYEVKSHSDA